LERKMTQDTNQAVLSNAKLLVLQGLFKMETLSVKGLKEFQKLKENNPDFDEHVGLLMGMVLSLFGGRFATTFSFAAAFHQSGYEDLLKNVNLIRAQVHHGRDAVLVDDVLDENHDGVADSSLLSTQDRIARRFDVFVNNVDPEVVNQAMSALWFGFLTATAAVRLKFANVIALGGTIARFLEKPALKYLLPKLQQVMDPKYHRWLPNLIHYVCRLIGTSIAFRMYRILATISSAISGGELILHSLASLCQKRGVTFITDGPLDEIVACGVVGTGIYAQLLGPEAPILFRFALFPLSVTEQILTAWVGA